MLPVKDDPLRQLSVDLLEVFDGLDHHGRDGIGDLLFRFVFPNRRKVAGEESKRRSFVEKKRDDEKKWGKTNLLGARVIVRCHEGPEAFAAGGGSLVVCVEAADHCVLERHIHAPGARAQLGAYLNDQLRGDGGQLAGLK